MSDGFAIFSAVVGTLIFLMLVWYRGWQVGVRDSRAKLKREGHL